MCNVRVGSFCLSLVTTTTLTFLTSQQSLYLPYHPSTVHTYTNMAVSYGLPTLLILVHAFLVHGCWRVLEGPPRPRGHWSAQVWGDLRLLLLAVFTTQALTGATKMLASRLRPNFIDVCVPSNPWQCATASLPTFVTNYSCAGNPGLFPEPAERERMVREARLSFPSGHTSLACAGMAWAVLYLQWCVPRLPALPRALLQALLALYAAFVSVSRVTDHKHHPTDVLAGAILGLTLATASLTWATTGGTRVVGGGAHQRVTSGEEKVGGEEERVKSCGGVELRQP